MKIHWDSLKWRHHENGMLQAYLNKSIRLHIWSKQLLKVTPWGGPIHSHRMDLDSEVLLGQIHHHHVTVHPGPGPFMLWSVNGASKNTVMEPLSEATANIGERISMGVEARYCVPRGSFHLAAPASDSVAVTMVTMGEKRGWASILTIGGEPTARVHSELPECAAGLIAAARAGVHR